MKVIHELAKSGKTYQLINWSAATGGVIVCDNAWQVDTILFRAEDMGLTIPRPVTYATTDKLRGTGLKAGIDDLEVFLNSFFPVPVDIVTITKKKGE